ncbi:MAG: spermidine synthase [Magnetospiraceae bacterium]
MPPSAVFRLAIYASAFLVGFVIMAFEILGSRYLHPHFGGGVHVWAALISTVLLALMLGYFAGGWLADQTPRPPTLGILVIISAGLMAGVPVLADSYFEAVFDSVESVALGALLAAGGLMLPPLTLLGAFSPFAVRLILVDTAHSGRVAGRVYGISTFGNILGTLATTYAFIPHFGTAAMTMTLAGVTALVGIGLVIPLRGARGVGAIAATVSLALGGQAAACSGAPVPIATFKTLASGNLETLESPYQTIFIDKIGNRVMMRFGYHERDAEQSVHDYLMPWSLQHDYARLMTLAPVYAQERKSLLIIGLGGGVVTRYLHRHLDDLDVTGVEIDPMVVACARKYFGFRESETYRAVVQDGRVFLRRAKGQKFDMILVDAYKRHAIPFHLMTREFYDILSDHLAGGGVAVFNFFRSEALFPRNLATLADVFDQLDVYETRDGHNHIVYAYRGPRRDAETLQKIAGALQRKGGFRHNLMRLLARGGPAPEPVSDAQILTDDFAPVGVLSGEQ